jgi:hypothetical protein
MALAGGVSRSATIVTITRPPIAAASAVRAIASARTSDTARSCHDVILFSRQIVISVTAGRSHQV